MNQSIVLYWLDISIMGCLLRWRWDFHLCVLSWMTSFPVPSCYMASSKMGPGRGSHLYLNGGPPRSLHCHPFHPPLHSYLPLHPYHQSRGKRNSRRSRWRPEWKLYLHCNGGQKAPCVLDDDIYGPAILDDLISKLLGRRSRRLSDVCLRPWVIKTSERMHVSPMIHHKPNSFSFCIDWNKDMSLLLKLLQPA